MLNAGFLCGPGIPVLRVKPREVKTYALTKTWIQLRKFEGFSMFSPLKVTDV